MSDELPVPAVFKGAKPYVRRAEELDRSPSNPDGPALAYFCRSYAMSKCLKLKGSNSGPEISSFLGSLMSSLEKARTTVPGTSKEEGKALCENFAMSIFMRAEEEDRSGNITGATAKQFYAAALMFDVMEQFGEMDAEVEEKRKYSKWKAADIIKAIKEGRAPQPGGPNGLQEVDPFAGLSDEPERAASVPIPPPVPSYVPPAANFQIPAAPSRPAASSAPVSPAMSPPAVPVPQYTPPPAQSYSYAPPAKTYANAPYSFSDPRVKDAMEYAEFAVAAMKRNEIQLAKDRLREALRHLE